MSARERRAIANLAWEGDSIERVVDHLKRICRNGGLELALQVGSVVIHHFYDGKVETWRARGPKATSFRRLAQHPELPMSPGALYRCVALFELCDRLEAPSRWRHLGASHLRTVLGLPVELQEQMLSDANANRWTVQRLEMEARKHRGMRAIKGGRRPQPALVIGLSRVRQGIENCWASVEARGSYERQHLQTSAQAIAEAQEALERLAAVVSRRIRDSSPPPPDSEADEPVNVEVSDE